MRPPFADPKTDFVFKRIFGTEAHKDLLKSLLEALLQLDEAHSIEELTFIPPEQAPVVPEQKFSIVDVKCRDRQGVSYVVEMQVLNVEGFEKRVVYNASKSYVSQLGRGIDYPVLNDVFAITICDFLLFEGEPEVPLASRWSMSEHSSGRRGLPQVQYVFLELPRYEQKDHPRDIVEQWAWFFRETRTLSAIPAGLPDPVRRALHAARTAGFTEAEWEAYDRARIAEQDARGALSLAQKQGRNEGIAIGKEEGIAIGKEEGIAIARAAAAAEARVTLWEIIQLRGWVPSEAERNTIEAASDPALLSRWSRQALRAASLAALLAG
jgi:predicted transposase/invertase (TIGR01784 family)